MFLLDSNTEQTAVRHPRWFQDGIRCFVSDFVSSFIVMDRTDGIVSFSLVNLTSTRNVIDSWPKWLRSKRQSVKHLMYLVLWLQSKRSSFSPTEFLVEFHNHFSINLCQRRTSIECDDTLDRRMIRIYLCPVMWSDLLDVWPVQWRKSRAKWNEQEGHFPPKLIRASAWWSVPKVWNRCRRTSLFYLSCRGNSKDVEETPRCSIVGYSCSFRRISRRTEQ